MSHDLMTNNFGAHMPMARASDVDVQVMTAKQFPRNLEQAKQEAMAIISDRETAESCFYMLPKGKDKIPGPSVRLAEIMVYTFGNIHSATRIVSNDGKEIICEGLVKDAQSNNVAVRQVATSIRTKDGRMYSPDMQSVVAAAGQAKAYRNAVFAALPRFLVNQLYEHARKIAVGTDKTLAERRRLAIEFFEKRGITRQKIFTFFAVENIEQVTLEHLEVMIGTKTALAEKMITVDQAFSVNTDTGEVVTQADELNEKLFGVEPQMEQPT